MKDLILALEILAKYANDDRNPTHCEHDVFRVCAGINEEDVTDEDIAKLDRLGFSWDGENFTSFRFGSN